MWEIIIPAVASLAGGALAGKGGSDASKAEQQAAQQNLQLSRDIYADQRGLARPGYIMGGGAANKLGALFNLAPQNYEAAYNGGMTSTGGLATGGLGAGQPVAGHSGGGGNNALAGFAAGGVPGAIMGGLIRNGGDNWQTLATEAPAGYDYGTYMQQPDLAAEWGKRGVQSLFGGNRDAYANWHYNKFGKTEGRTLNPMGGNTQTPQPTGGTQLVGQSGQAATMDPLQEFMDSPYNKLATRATELDFGKIKGQLGAAGKSISGPGEARYAKTLAGNRLGAFDSYTSGLRSLAGMEQTAGSQISSAANQYGLRAGAAITDAGTAKGNALRSRYAGLGQGISGAAGAVGDYFRKPATGTY